MTDAAATAGRSSAQTNTVYAIILAVSVCHLINDVMQSLLAAIYPMLKSDFGLDFWQIGFLTFAFQITASVLQPMIGIYTDKRPMPYSLTVGMASSMIGLILLATAHSYWMLVAGACCIGVGSSIFHPESSRVARLASGGRYGLAQSFFQVGGNFGQALGPLLAAFIVAALGPRKRRLVLDCRVARHGHFVEGRELVQCVPARGGKAAGHDAREHAAAWQDCDRPDRAGDPHLQQECLYGCHVQLLYVLRDRTL